MLAAAVAMAQSIQHYTAFIQLLICMHAVRASIVSMQHRLCYIAYGANGIGSAVPAKMLLGQH
jgi:hypothetical protein